MEKTIALATDNTVKITSRQRRATTVPISEIVTSLQEQQARAKDLVVLVGQMRAARTGREMEIQVGPAMMRMFDRVLPQLCSATTHDGVSLPGEYMRKLLSAGSEEHTDLACYNVNQLLAMKAVSAPRKHLIRTLLDDDNRPVIRAILSDRYLPLNSLDMVTTALGVVLGKVGNVESAKGAKAFDWYIDPFRLSVGFVNPGVAFDLKNPGRGIIHGENKQDAHGWVYPGGGSFDMRSTGKKADTHLVFPACYISNSDTGAGSASVEMAILEAACINTCRIGSTVSKRHLGSQVEGDEYDSSTTQKKLREAFLSKVVDGLTQVFDPRQFEENCRKMLALDSVEVKSVVELGKALFETALPGGDAMLNEFLLSYEQFTPGKDTLLNVHRALTDIAQDCDQERKERLESFAGDMLMKGTV